MTWRGLVPWSAALLTAGSAAAAPLAARAAPAVDGASPGASRTPGALGASGASGAPGASRTPGAPSEGQPAPIRLPAGKLVPFFAPRPATSGASAGATSGPSAGTPAASAAATAPRAPVDIPAFELDVTPVTNAQMLRFVTQAPKWRRSRVARVFAESTYLATWRGDLELGQLSPNAPVTHVSWFAAQAYCQTSGGSLPTTTQWEYALADAGRGEALRQQQVLSWYAQPSGEPPGDVAQRGANGYGVKDLVGLVWEWTLDFSADLLGSEPRNSGTKEETWFCGAGSLGALDPSDYATFMRYSFRASLRARFTTGNLGFRCARELPAPPPGRGVRKGSGKPAGKPAAGPLSGPMIEKESSP